MPLIKICGVKDPAMAKFCAACGADYIGIVFALRSKRCVSFSQAQRIAAAAKEAGAIPVGVFVGMGAKEIVATAEKAGIAHIQAYGLDEPLPLEFYRFYPDRKEMPLRQDKDFLLLDGAEPGSGKRFDWDRFVPPSVAWFLAGGLNGDNIDAALLRLKPQGVDVSSGVETDGEKDPEKIKAFIEKVKKYE